MFPDYTEKAAQVPSAQIELEQLEKAVSFLGEKTAALETRLSFVMRSPVPIAPPSMVNDGRVGGPDPAPLTQKARIVRAQVDELSRRMDAILSRLDV